MMTMEGLPEILLEHVLSYLSISDRSILLGTNRQLYSFKTDLEQRQRILEVRSFDIKLLGPTHFPLRLYQNLCNVHTLDLGSHCIDAFLQVMTDHQLFPLLKHISMVRSPFVTDRGLECLSRHTGGAIESIDITFCRKTTFAGSLCLRDKLRPSLKVLRRQPAWLDGHFHTPFNEEGDEVEVHTYYPDGTFTFNRANQSRGFVAELEEWNDSGTYLADKLQYVDFDPPPGWPTWTTYSYRPGVCLLKLPDQRTVLVGQTLRGLKPPRILDLMTSVTTTIQTGQSLYFNANEEPLEARPTDGGIMISKMRVFPLDSLMAPDDLLVDCRTACEIMNDLGDDIVNTGERFLNDSLS